MSWAAAAAGAAILGVTAAATAVIRQKNMHYWLPSYLLPAERAVRPDPSRPRHVFIAVCDHWEPGNDGADPDLAMERVDRWADEYPRLHREFSDSSGRPPQHTFFYPEEEYRPEHIDRIGALCRAGFGDVEIHLHHDKDTPAGFEEKLTRFRDILFNRHGLLRRDPNTGGITYGFIHGNWSLCNSHPDGVDCGVDQELGILYRTGCYADFTMPSAPDPTQTRTVNSIYYARDIDGRRKSHDSGVTARVGQSAILDHLLMIQGPLTLDWKQRRFGIVPRIENGDIIAGRPMTITRLDQWLAAGVGVLGRPNWQFVKLHTHGCKVGNIDAWLGGEMGQFHRDLRRRAGEDPMFRYHYVTAWEMAQLVHQAEEQVVEPSIVTAARFADTSDKGL